MLGSVLWKVFEKTGNIDAYLLYVDMKSNSTPDKDEHRAESCKDAVQVK